VFKRILAAVDVADPDKGRAIAAIAADIARGSGAELRLMTVPLMLEAIRDYLPAGVMANDEAAAVKQLEAIGASIDLPAGKLSVVAPPGNIADRTLAAAEAFGADLIVIGPHKPSLAKMILGSNASAILKNAKVSVLVAR
jgi:nucleotide-binding universal stress UspA family protein